MRRENFGVPYQRDAEKRGRQAKKGRDGKGLAMFKSFW